jgi:HAD superfamily hydrolase (TIGR01509 family)
MRGIMTGARAGGTRELACPVFQAAIFDCDGLLLDSSAAWASAFDRGAKEVGGSLSDQHHRLLLGSSVDAGAARIARWAGRSGQAGSVRAHIHDALLAAVRERPPRPLPGAAALLTALRDRLPLAVASNAPADVLAAELHSSGLRPAFQAVVSADSVPRPKPAPDVYLAACAALDVDPSAAVALEDSADGATAAQQARLSLVVVTDGAWPQRRPLAWPAQRRSALYVTGLADPSVRAHLLAVTERAAG